VSSFSLRLRRRPDPGNPRGTAADPVPHANLETSRRREEQIHAGPEPDQPDPLSPLDLVAGLFPAHDAAGNDAGNL
jgi:hypothetical protein